MVTRVMLRNLLPKFIVGIGFMALIAIISGANFNSSHENDSGAVEVVVGEEQ